MGRCVVHGCGNDRRKYPAGGINLTFHRLPKSPELMEEWARRLGREPGWVPAKTAIICSQHFCPRDLKVKRKGRPDETRVLKPHAVPSVFLVNASRGTPSNFDGDAAPVDYGEDVFDATVDVDDQNDIILSRTRTEIDLLWKEFLAFYTRETFCDVTLVCKNGATLRCHRVMLASLSRLMYSLLRQDPFHRTEEAIFIHLPDIELASMKGILDFAYAGFPKIDGKSGARPALGFHKDVMFLLDIDLARPVVSTHSEADDPLDFERNGLGARHSAVSDSTYWRQVWKKEPVVKLEPLGHDLLDKYGVFLPESVNSLDTSFKSDEEELQDDMSCANEDLGHLVNHNVEHYRYEDDVESSKSKSHEQLFTMNHKLETCEGQLFVTMKSMPYFPTGLVKKYKFRAALGIRSMDTPTHLEAFPLAWTQVSGGKDVSALFIRARDALKNVYGFSEASLCDNRRLLSLQGIDAKGAFKDARAKAKINLAETRGREAKKAKLSQNRCLDMFKEKPAKKAFEITTGDCTLHLSRKLSTEDMEAVLFASLDQNNVLSSSVFQLDKSLSINLQAQELSTDVIMMLASRGSDGEVKLPKSEILRDLFMDSMAIQEECKMLRQVLSQAKKTKGNQGTYPVEKFESMCEICGKNIKGKSGFRVHMKAQHDPVDCPVCHREFAGTSRMKSHLTKEHREEFKSLCVVCHQCGKSFRDQAEISRHMKRSHPDEKDAVHCDKCGKAFGFASDLAAHAVKCRRRSVAKSGKSRTSAETKESSTPKKSASSRMEYVFANLTCKPCNVTFKAHTDLMRHYKQLHRELFEQEAPRCRVCAAKFVSRAQRNCHEVQSHQPDSAKPHQCPQCTRSFLRKSSMRQHLKNVHTEEASRVIPCGYNCGAFFKEHMRASWHETKVHGARFSKAVSRTDVQT